MNGIICINKPQEMTSFVCCAIMRRVFGEKKVGHAGTLDPMATGVLPILFGKATRALDFIPVQEKRYTATLQFGLNSDTLDIWGNVTPTGKPYPALTDIEAVLPQFRGEIMQIPPMVSALKKDGVRLYDLARQGIEIERPARPVTIHALELLQYDRETGILILNCHCSKGTYIRTICDDIGRMLGCGAVMTALCRTMAAGLTLEQAVPLPETPDDAALLTPHILTLDTLFAPYPAVSVSPAQAVRFQNGGALDTVRLKRLPQTDAPVRVHAPDGTFLGLGSMTDTQLKVLKLF